MKPHITMLTLGVSDLERSVACYRDGLGFSTKGINGTEFENGAVAFFNLQSGLKLALRLRASLAADTGLPMQTTSALELSLGQNVSSEQEVDAVMHHAERAGATIVKPAQRTFYGGYAGYFQTQMVICGKSHSIPALHRLVSHSAASALRPTPNRSLQPTCYGWIRQPAPAAELKR